MAMMTPVLAAIAISKGAFPPEGWEGSSYLEVLAGWSLLTVPYVLAFGIPLALICLTAARLLRLSSTGAITLFLGVAFGLFVVMAANV